MTEPHLYTAAEAKALRENATDGPWHAITTGTAGGDHWYVTDAGESIASVSANDGIDEDIREPNARLLAASPGLAATVEHQAEEIEKFKNTVQLLGRMTEWMQMDTVRAAGLDHMVHEDGDGDWGMIWELIWEKLRDHTAQAAQITRLQAAVREYATPPNTISDLVRRGILEEGDI